MSYNFVYTPDKVTLITRPRRFGKTLNLSTIECFFSCKYAGRNDLFEGKAIWREEKYRQLPGTYPVIFMSFADAKTTEDASMTDIEQMKAAVKQIITKVYHEHKSIIKSEIFDSDDRKQFASINKNMDDLTAASAISRLCTYLEKYYSRKTIILLDEYDTPLQEAWLYGYWDKAVKFFRSFFGSTFKNIDDFDRAVITGITRISKESIFSDLNHLDVVTTTSDEYAEYFGFTEEEVFQSLDDAEMSEHKAGIKNGMTVLLSADSPTSTIRGQSHPS